MNSILDIMNFRFACKTFDPQRKIPEDQFHTILEAGRLSPSSYGFEPWKFLVIQNKELREAIKAVAWGAQTQLPTASHVVVLLARQPEAITPTSEYLQKTIMQETQHMPEDIQKAYTEKYADFLKNDFALAGNERAGFEWACRQAYLALDSMMIAAASMQIDSGPMEGFNKEKLELLLAEHEILDRKTFGVACMIAFGYRTEPPHRPKMRRPLDQVVQWVS